MTPSLLVRSRFAYIASWASLLSIAAPALAYPAHTRLSDGASLILSLQCVPYARRTSGIKIYGDAHTWWEQATNHYARGPLPKLGAVMAFRSYGHMVLGHVAVVTKIVDARTILISHANWSPVHGKRGKIEHNVRAVDVSPGNDWSKVRVWFAPLHGMGTTHWPVMGFIYARPSPPAGMHTPHGLDGDPIGEIIASLANETTAPTYHQKRITRLSPHLLSPQRRLRE